MFCALFVAVLALLAALLAAPFITVREPLLACTYAMAHRRYHSCQQRGVACVHHDLARQRQLQLISSTNRRRTFSPRLGFLSVLPRKFFWSNMFAISTCDTAVGVDGQIQRQRHFLILAHLDLWVRCARARVRRITHLLLMQKWLLMGCVLTQVDGRTMFTLIGKTGFV